MWSRLPSWICLRFRVHLSSESQAHWQAQADQTQTFPQFSYWWKCSKFLGPQERRHWAGTGTGQARVTASVENILNIVKDRALRCWESWWCESVFQAGAPESVSHYCGPRHNLYHYDDSESNPDFESSYDSSSLSFTAAGKNHDTWYESLRLRQRGWHGISWLGLRNTPWTFAAMPQAELPSFVIAAVFDSDWAVMVANWRETLVRTLPEVGPQQQ